MRDSDEPYLPSMLETGLRSDRSLKERSFGIPDSVTSDAHEGIRAALRAVFNATPWQRCQFHLQQNAQAYVHKLDMRESVAADIQSVFNAHTLALAEAKLDGLVENIIRAHRLSAIGCKKPSPKDSKSSTYRRIKESA
jgi:transposase-like protein